MPASVDTFLKNLPGKPFVVQFVVSVTVEGHADPVTEIETHLLAAASIDDARTAALSKIGRISDAYNNSLGELVTIECLGIHQILEPTYVSKGRWLHLANFAYGPATKTEHLINEPEYRPDLPRRGQ
jgi:hypothetical protein